MGDSYSENPGYWANADSKQSTSAANKQTLESIEAQSEVVLDQNSIEPVRLTFSPPAAAQRHSLDQLTMHYAGPIPGPGQHPHDSREAVVELSAADATPTASMLEGVQTPDLPEQHTGSVGARSLHTAPAVLQISEEEGSPPGMESSGGVTPDVGDAELADVARLWQECQHGRSARRRARTSVTSMYSSGAMEALLEDIKGQRAAADLQLAAARQEKSAAAEVASTAGYEGFRIERQLLHNLESAVGRAAAAQSDKEQLRVDLRSSLDQIAAAQEQQQCLVQQLQAEEKVRGAAEAALRASQAEVQALSAKARRSEKRRKRLQTTMEGITEASQQPMLTHGQSLAASQGGWPGVGSAAADSLLSSYACSPQHPGQDEASPWAASLPDTAHAAQLLPRQPLPSGMHPEREGSREAYSTPSSWLQRAGSPAGCEAGRPPSERRQLARELSAEALAAEYDRSAESGYAEETDTGLTPSRLLLRLREARAAASSAASGARRARAAAAAAEMRLATAEAAEQRACARLLAAEQRGHALGEQCRRLHARLGRTEVDLAQLRRQNESMLRDVSLKAGALREHQAKHDSSRVEIEQLQQQVLHVREEAGAELSKHVQEVQHLHEESKADKALAACQKDELEQSTARQTELQHAAVDREAAAQDLWVRLEAERRALVGERERGTQAAAQLAAALQQMEELAKSVEVLRQDSEASGAALREAQVALEERQAGAAQHASVLEAETADLRARNGQLATQAEAAHSECCRLEAALLSQQLHTKEYQQELQESQAEQEGLREACAAAESAVGAAQASEVSLEAHKAALQAEGQRLQAENAKLLSRLQAVDGSRDRSVQDAENRLVDVQTELMAAHYDADLASEALRSSREHLSDLSFHMEDGQAQISELEARAAELEEQAGTANAARADAEAKAADLALQVAEERERARKLAEKLATARHASSAAAMRAQLASAEDAKCKANQHAEHLRQKLMLARKEAAAREAALKEEAAAARGEAEAAAQLVHALKPKGDLALGTLWTQLMEAHSRATLAVKAPTHRPGREDTSAEAAESDDDGSRMQHVLGMWAQLVAARREAEQQQCELAIAQARLTASTSKNQIVHRPASACSANAESWQPSPTEQPPECSPETAVSAASEMDQVLLSPAPAELPSQAGCGQAGASDAQGMTPCSSISLSGPNPGCGLGMGTETSEDSPESCQEQNDKCAEVEESPIRGLVLLEHPAESRVIAERVGNILKEDAFVHLSDHDSHPARPPQQGLSEISGCLSPADKACRLQSQPLDDIDDSVSSSGEAELATEAARPAKEPSQRSPYQEQVLPSTLPCGADGDAAQIQPHSYSSSKSAQALAHPHSGPEEVQACERRSTVPEDMAPISEVSAPLQSIPHVNDYAESSVGENLSRDDLSQLSPDSPAAPDMGSAQASQAPTRQIATPAPQSRVRTTKASAGLLPMVRLGGLQKVLLGGGVVIVAWLAAMQRTRSILQPLRFILRVLSLYQEIMQRLQ